VTCGSIFDAPRLSKELAILEEKLGDPSVWGDAAQSQVLMRDRKRVEGQLAYDHELSRRAGDIDSYFEQN
jgi:peptide chain release factor 2